MPQKKVTIVCKNISQRQWSNLILELNLMKKAWAPYAGINIEGHGIKKIVEWGTNNFDSKAIPAEKK